MRELALFAGGGGGILGGLILGWRTVCAVEIDAYARRVLLARQRDGFLARFPIWDDVCTFDGTPWRGHVDVISGGFPCQDISPAGKRAGLAGSRSGLWSQYARIIGEVRPRWIFAENSAHLRGNGLAQVLEDLAALGFDARWGVLGAADVGAPHERRRMWVVAHSNDGGQRVKPVDAEVACSSAADGALRSTPDASALRCGPERELSPPSADSDREPLRLQPGRRSGAPGAQEAVVRVADWWPVDLVSGVDDGLANRMDRVRATGNGQVPRVAALAWRLLGGEVTL